MLKLDLTYLESISGSDKVFINEMLTLFITSTFPELEQLKHHANERSWDLMSSTAHKMKAPIQMLGIPEVSALIISIETLGKTNPSVMDITPKMEQLELYIHELEIVIRNYLAS
jgi:HPt (histidine-containing phosphotransfer) domain-containing protein